MMIQVTTYFLSCGSYVEKLDILILFVWIKFHHYLNLSNLMKRNI
jgi:hypothetical protein